MEKYNLGVALHRPMVSRDKPAWGRGGELCQLAVEIGSGDCSPREMIYSWLGRLQPGYWDQSCC